MDEMEELLTGNRIFKQRLVNIGVLSSNDAIQWGVSGVLLRGSGIAHDLRKSQPYECYDQVEFNVPVGTNSDCYDRYLLRMDATKFKHNQTNGLNARKSMSKHSSVAARPRAVLIKTDMESLIKHLKHPQVALHCGRNLLFYRAPKGEFGVNGQ
jgi:NADH-quinone oxidoreductase subunit D